MDALSSAHVYVRLNSGESWRDMPKELVWEMCQLVKDNSIEGCKKDKVDIVYTPCDNLKKTASMDVGQVGFKVAKGSRRSPDVVKVREVAKDKDVLKRISKTQEEKFPNLELMREERNAKEARERREKMKVMQKEKEAQELVHKEEKMKWVNAMEEYHDDDKMISNKDIDPEEDFL